MTTPFLGILMLDTAFVRPVGDVGNVNSFTCPARIRIVPGAGSLDIVRDGLPSPELIDAFINAAQELERAGAFAITSTCGFLITIEDQIAAAVTIPVRVSGLSYYRDIARLYPKQKIGILTASKPALGDIALRAAGINPANVHIAGMQDCAAFADMILQPKSNQPDHIDMDAISHYCVEQAMRLVTQHYDIAVFLLECGNLPPYADQITAATGRPVHSIVSQIYS
tara:strand:- start:2264 stop:2938 length:675 start_codon:yes stop_codon:yes gene_type:complete